MTVEEIEQFKNTIADTILPYAKYMKNEQIQEIIKSVLKNNPEMPSEFANMVLEQIILMKQ